MLITLPYYVILIGKTWYYFHDTKLVASKQKMHHILPFGGGSAAGARQGDICKQSLLVDFLMSSDR